MKIECRNALTDKLQFKSKCTIQFDTYQIAKGNIYIFLINPGS